ncbi:MAG: hypothetical protein A2020_14120 [Lentisphaerae bacterium GWF2_45_14]|nr:MAG: hypothetical protein A2020_14120 [Lentisphaerae bacterium GWF2_45_14]
MGQYYYLISSLPMIRQDEVPGISIESFLEECAKWLDENEMGIINGLSLVPGVTEEAFKVESLESWTEWEDCLRNRLARQRGHKLNRDVEAVCRHENDWFSEVDRAAQDFSGASNPLSREKMLDDLRWKKLEDLECGHIFDFDRLCVYKLKLMLRLKWSDRKKEPGEKNFSELLDNVYGTQAAKQD